MKRTIHSKGKDVTVADRINNPCLDSKMRWHTACGYLLDNIEENECRVTVIEHRVTCKLCLKIIKNGLEK